jgi:hypothetical protein
MAESDHPTDLQTRSWMQNPGVYTHREVIDLSALPIGPMEDPPPGFSRRCENLGNLRGALFGNDDDETPQGSSILRPLSTEGHNVTLASSEQGTTTSNHEQEALEGLLSTEQQDRVDVDASLRDNVITVLDEALLPPNKRPQIRFAYAKRFFYATSEDLYLRVDSNFSGPFTLPELVGQVVTCPNKNNQNLYEIAWIQLRCGGTISPTLLPNLRKFFPKAELYPVLSSLILACPLNSVNEQSTAAVSVSQSTTLLLGPRPAPQPVQERRPDPPPVVPIQEDGPPLLLQTPSPTQRSVFANLYTAALSVSGVSSLGNSNTEQSTGEQSRRMRTRNSGEDDDEYDSDGDKTVGEDIYDVNFNENFWQTTTSPDDPVVEEEEEGEDPNCPCCPANAPMNDCARLLQGCTRFDFCQLTIKQADKCHLHKKYTMVIVG